MADEKTASENRMRGPKGGTTTVTRTGMVKKNFWLPGDLVQVLELRAKREGRSEADLVRRGLRLILNEAAEQ